MKQDRLKKSFVVLVSASLLFLGLPPLATSAQDSSQSQGQSGGDQSNQSSSQGSDQDQGPENGTSSDPNSAAPAPLSSDALNALVAPIALYPDALVAQVLAASTYPDEVAIADYWLGQNKSMSSSDLATAVNNQTWDPSVKALCQFPSVLDNMAHNLAWTSSLGQAYENQQSDVMNAVQVMRAKAQASGALQSNSQVTVVQQAPQTIVIKPANPQIVYVPEYNPTVVYGTPYVVPLYTPPPVAVVGAAIGFGAGIAIGAAIGGGGYVGGGFVGGGWGGFGWGLQPRENR